MSADIGNRLTPALRTYDLSGLIGGAPSIESLISVTGEEMTYSPLAHLPRSIKRQRSLQKGKSEFLLGTGFLQVGHDSLPARLRAMILR